MQALLDAPRCDLYYNTNDYKREIPTTTIGNEDMKSHCQIYSGFQNEEMQNKMSYLEPYVELLDRDLWRQFYMNGTEMILTKSGR